MAGLLGAFPGSPQSSIPPSKPFPPSSLVAPAVFEVSKSLPSSSDTHCLDGQNLSSSPPSKGCTSSVPHLASGVAATGFMPEAVVQVLYHGNLVRCRSCHKIGHRSAQCNSNLLPLAYELPGSVSELVNSTQPPSLPASAPQVLTSNQIENLALIEAGEAESLNEVDDIVGSSLLSTVQLSPVETPNTGGRLPSDELPFAGSKGDVNFVTGSNPRIEHVLPSYSELSRLKDNGACLHADGHIKTSYADILKRGVKIDEAVKPGNGVVQGVDALKFSFISDGFSEDSQESKLKFLSPLARRVAARINSLCRAVDKSAHKDVALHGLASSPSDFSILGRIGLDDMALAAVLNSRSEGFSPGMRSNADLECHSVLPGLESLLNMPGCGLWPVCFRLVFARCGVETDLA
ncbi:hypothetical protein Nepgr_027170 [Nepenthes gracilis]|uniref:Uncharacterized protein n=1 Tax=Nepenthes gracilis TaxID=150966 RepID=A0AAD3T9J9_NEPGR|nr:hypothetical protein Nepgr_027170 [Nepenthes gracilis]